MRIGTLIAIYFVVWWIVLFAVLPWGVRTQDEEGEVVLGTTSSAPVRPHLVRKAIVTSIVSAIVVFFIWLAFDRYGLSVERLADLFRLTRFANKKARPFGLASRVPRLNPSCPIQGPTG